MCDIAGEWRGRENMLTIENINILVYLVSCPVSECLM